jgi:hypothetical protein
MAQRGQRMAKLFVAADAEIGGSHIHLLLARRLEQIVQHVGQAVFYVVDNKGNALHKVSTTPSQN